MRGRPRKHLTNAIKQAEYRKRRDAAQRQKLVQKLLRRMRGATEHDLNEMTIRQLRYWTRFSAPRKRIRSGRS